jgi:purine-nucleoside phosphorylase
MKIEDIQQSASFLLKKGFAEPRVGIVLGTGLHHLVSFIKDPVMVEYKDIPHFPVSTVEFHKSQLIFGSIEGIDVVVMQGRLHYYEGFSMQQITFPVRVMKELGIEYLLLSNAAGGLNLSYKKGDLIITEDHINMLPDNPLRGLGSSWGNRFVDLSEPYDRDLQQVISEAFVQENLPVKKGVYVAVMGPNLETRAEYRWLRNTGADMVGMSTVPEVIVANQLELKVAAISVITDECDPDHLEKVNIPELLESAARADKILAAVMLRVLKTLTGIKT